MGRSWHNTVYYTFRVLEWGFLFAATIFGTLLLLDPKEWPMLDRAIVWMQTRQAWVPLATLLTGAAKLGADKIGPRWIHEQLQAIVDSLRDASFTQRARSNSPVHHHRVTVFRWCYCWRLCCWGRKINGKRRWPWTGWLVPIARSGHTTKSTNTVFVAPDDADNAEGIAGQTWSQNQVVHSGPLPLPADASDTQAIAAYAQGGYVSPQWVRNKLEKALPLPRNLYGTPLEVHGKPWGVVVIDSRNENDIDPRLVRDAFRTFSRTLSAIAPRVPR